MRNFSKKKENGGETVRKYRKSLRNIYLYKYG
jgi:hypothetical protein